MLILELVFEIREIGTNCIKIFYSCYGVCFSKSVFLSYIVFYVGQNSKMLEISFNWDN